MTRLTFLKTTLAAAVAGFTGLLAKRPDFETWMQQNGFTVTYEIAKREGWFIGYIMVYHGPPKIASWGLHSMVKAPSRPELEQLRPLRLKALAKGLSGKTINVGEKTMGTYDWKLGTVEEPRYLTNCFITFPYFA